MQMLFPNVLTYPGDINIPNYDKQPLLDTPPIPYKGEPIKLRAYLYNLGWSLLRNTDRKALPVLETYDEEMARLGAVLESLTTTENNIEDNLTIEAWNGYNSGGFAVYTSQPRKELPLQSFFAVHKPSININGVLFQFQPQLNSGESVKKAVGRILPISVAT